MAEIILEQNLEGFSGDTEALGEAIIKMQKSLSWLLAHLDSRNVQSINTNITEVKSDDGATVLDGNQIRMLDGKGRLRATFGKGENGDFIFEIYDASGSPSIHLDEEGDAVFSGKKTLFSVSNSFLYNPKTPPYVPQLPLSSTIP